MHKTKKKTKTAKLPKPIKVKKEKSDEERLPQPMTHYIDDRLEMVKHIFNTLKPKTIINLAPDFLKTKPLEEIEEECLNELLCISTKRLKSIISATKCPTDTESSDNDSDVERHEEHISLEEISSDSEIEGSSSKKGKKKKSTKTGESEAAKKDTPNENNPEDGQISVLELLELQARARAIRSQLALEPVTKIEVNSDEEKQNDDRGKSSKKDEKINKNLRKRLSSERESRDSTKISRINEMTESLSSKSNEKDEEKRSSRKIKLKRSHRSSNNKEKEDEVNDRLGNEKDTPKDDREKTDKPSTKEKSKEYEKNKNKPTLIQDIKKEKTSRSPSPDVIPIIAEPETLLITDSSDDEQKNKNKNKSKDSKVNTNEKAANEVAQAETQQRECKKNEPEEEKENASKLKNDTKENPSGEDNLSIADSTENTQDSQHKLSDKEDVKDTKIRNSDLKVSINKERLKNHEEISKKPNDENNSTNHSDDDQNDDVISLGGDLENEMNEQLKNEVDNDKKPTEDLSQDNNKSQDESQPDDVISLQSSEDERMADAQSWHSRYMKSSKVSKVLAASRLGKRVRDKIKKSKHSKKEAASHENSEADKEKSTPVFTSKHEDGSVEQYKELLEMRQRKS